jgi:hypothetical protein
MVYTGGVTREHYDRGYAGGLEIDPARHPSTRHFASLFACGHLKHETALNTSRQFAALAQWSVDYLSDGPELSACLRKLLEAKDCAVRAILYGWPG